MNYASAVWEFSELNDPQVFQNRVQRYFLGVNKFTPTATTRIEFNWLDPKYQRWVEILRYKHRLAKMKDTRLPVRVYKWDKSLRVEAWSNQVAYILSYCNMEDCMNLHTTCDLDVAKARLLKLNQNQWWIDSSISGTPIHPGPLCFIFTSPCPVSSHSDSHSLACPPPGRKITVLHIVVAL